MGKQQTESCLCNPGVPFTGRKNLFSCKAPFHTSFTAQQSSQWNKCPTIGESTINFEELEVNELGMRCVRHNEGTTRKKRLCNMEGTPHCCFQVSDYIKISVKPERDQQHWSPIARNFFYFTITASSCISWSHETLINQELGFEFQFEFESSQKSCNFFLTIMPIYLRFPCYPIYLKRCLKRYLYFL